MRARYYNVDIKRFINQDVIEGSITNSPSLNKYAYCQGNPVSLLDPFGLSPQGSSSFGWHLLLDILGFVPVVGIFADIANGFWYLAEGNYAAAIGSFISAVPMIGDAVGIFTTAITGCTKMAKIIGYGTRLFSRVGNMALGVYEFSKNAYELYDRHKDPDFKWDKDTKGLAVNAAVSLGVAAVEAVGFARDIGNYNAVKYDIATSQCFVSGTLVLTIDGNKPIEEIKAGDLVYSTNPETGESEYKEVVQTFENETEELIHISIAGEEIVTTPKHPFYVPQKGWTSAINLRAGDMLVLSNGEYVIVEKVQHEILESPVKVYNFEVHDFHTYYVGENSVLVHNKCGEAHNAASYEKLKEQYDLEEQAGDVVESLNRNGQLPSNYITKDDARALGWSNSKALNNYAPGNAIGGDVFDNKNNLLPNKNGRIWYEADIGQDYTMKRSNPNNPAYRIVYSNDGLIYGTIDHYQTFFSMNY